MSHGEHFFGLFRGAVSDDRAVAIQSVLNEYDCTLISGYRDHDDAPERGWIAGPNRGWPHDDEMAAAVREVLDARGLWPIPDAGRARGRPYELAPQERRKHRVRVQSLTDDEVDALDRAAGGKDQRGAYLYRLLMADLDRLGLL